MTELTPLVAAQTLLVGAAAAAINAVAGGGSLISFPFVAHSLGLGEVRGNATNAVGLWPGALTGALAFRLDETARAALKRLGPPTAVGAILGAWLLTRTPESLFEAIVPWLILVAAAMLFLQPKIRSLVGAERKLPFPAAMAVQFLVALYGGYFGAGMGLMMLAVLALLMEGTIHVLNGVKNWLGLIINFVGSGYFLVVGLVRVEVALLLVIGSLVGGYAAGRYSQRVDAEKLRLAVAIYGVGMAAYFWIRR